MGETDFQDILDTKYYSDNELMIAIGYWAVWALIYVHMSYPNYPLCVDDMPFYGEGGKMMEMVDPDANGVATSLDKVSKAIPEWDEVVSWYKFEIDWPEEEVCEDNFSFAACSNVVRRNYCGYGYYKKNCAKTCGTC